MSALGQKQTVQRKTSCPIYPQKKTFAGCDHVGDVKSRPRHLLDPKSLTILPHLAASRRPRSGRNRMFQSTLRCGALGCVLAFAFASVAGAQLLSHRDLSASMAITIAQTTIETCKANGYAVSATVVGHNGEIIAQVRGDNTGPHTIENSFRKAYTARTFRAPSGAMVDRAKADPTLGLIHLTNVIANQGALPIKVGDEVIGAAGASGASGGEKDEACVKAGIDKVADQLK